MQASQRLGDDRQASVKFASAPCRRAIDEAYALWHRSNTRKSRLERAQEVFRANVSGRLVWYIRNQSDAAPPNQHTPIHTHVVGIAAAPWEWLTGMSQRLASGVLARINSELVGIAHAPRYNPCITHA